MADAIFSKNGSEYIKAKIEELYKKIISDKDILAKFKSEPIKTVEGLLGIDLPDEQIEKLVEGIKAKIDIEKNFILC